MEQRLARFRAARDAAQPVAAVAERTPEPGLKVSSGDPDRLAQGGVRRPALARDVAAAGAAPWGARALLAHVVLLKFLLWLVLLGLAAELHFGLPYFVLSLFYWLYTGTRGPGQRRPGEVSAYSVFNPGCRAIQGALTAEQLERELGCAPAR